MSKAIKFYELPNIGSELAGGKFAGLTTQKDGTQAAVILLPRQTTELTWDEAVTWAKKLGAELPSRPVASLLFANLKSDLRPRWHWTSEEIDASYAWDCSFGGGSMVNTHKRYEGSAVAVRLVQIV